MFFGFFTYQPIALSFTPNTQIFFFLSINSAFSSSSRWKNLNRVLSKQSPSSPFSSQDFHDYFHNKVLSIRTNRSSLFYFLPSMVDNMSAIEIICSQIDSIQAALNTLKSNVLNLIKSEEPSVPKKRGRKPKTIITSSPSLFSPTTFSLTTSYPSTTLLFSTTTFTSTTTSPLTTSIFSTTTSLMLLYAVILFAPACIHTFICLKMLSPPNAEEEKSRDRYPVSESFGCKSLMIFYKNSVFHVSSLAPPLTSHVLIILICRYFQRHLTPKPFGKRRTPYFTGLLHFLPGLLRNMIFFLITLALFSGLRLI